jgi:hypothetical protein
VSLASVYRKGALISVPAAVGRTPISPTETTLAAKSPLVGRVDHSGAFTRTPAPTTPALAFSHFLPTGIPTGPTAPAPQDTRPTMPGLTHNRNPAAPVSSRPVPETAATAPLRLSAQRDPLCLAVRGDIPQGVGQSGKSIDHHCLGYKQQHGHLDDDEFARPPNDPERNDQCCGSGWWMTDFEQNHASARGRQ